MQNYKYTHYLKIFLYLLIFFTVIQILLGALVRLTNSGLSCPDWPLCYGMIIPFTSDIINTNNLDYSLFQIMLEWVHRLNAAVVIAPLVALITVCCYIIRKVYKKLWKASLLLLVMLLLQSMLGGFTVFDANSPWSVAIHLTIAFIFFGITINMVFLAIDKNKMEKLYLIVADKNKYNLYVAITLVLVTSALGGFTSKSGSSLACSEWPLCNNNRFPHINDWKELIHFLHRFLAMLVFISITQVYFQLYSLLKKKSYFY